MTRPIEDIYLGGCNVWWKDGKVDSTGVALDGDDACEFSLYESDYPDSEDSGTVVTGADGVAMSFVSGSSGNFVGHLAATASLTRDSYYVLEVTATPDGGTAHTRRAIVQAVDRGLNP